VLSLANRFATDEELDPSELSSGQEANNFLKRFGFHIAEIPSLGTFVMPPPSQKRTFEETQKGT
jgi:hypothetical protein